MSDSTSRSSILGALLICVSAALWGLDGVVLTPRLSNLPVPFVVFLVHAVPFLLMQPFLHSAYRVLARMDFQGWLSLLAVAVTGGLVGTLAIVKALFLVNFDRLSVVVLLQKLQPVFAIALAALLLRERLSARFLKWSVTAICGAWLLTFGLELPDLHGDAATARAAAWALLAAACFGFATVLGKKLLASVGFVDATFGRYGLTSLLALLYLLSVGIGIPLSEVTPHNWVIILVISFTTGSGAIFLYYFGLSRVRASVAAVCELCLPLSAVVLDYFVNGSVLSISQWVGAAILVVSIIRITTGETKSG